MDRSTSRTVAVPEDRSTTPDTLPLQDAGKDVATKDVSSAEVTARDVPAPPSTPVPPSAPAVPAPIGRNPEPRRWPRSLTAALVVAVLLISGAVALNVTTGALQNLNPFRNGVVQERTIDRSSPAVLKAITDLGQFQAASGYYELVVDVEKDVKPVPSFLAGERVLFVAAGSVDVGVDLRGLGNGAVKINADRTSATITLPHPSLSQPNLDLQHSYVYSQQRGLMNRIKDAVGSNATDQQQLYALATQKLAAAARQSNELTTRGETNTRSMLEGLLRSLGFTDVTIQFA
jgi:hypothetical protein